MPTDTTQPVVLAADTGEDYPPEAQTATVEWRTSPRPGEEEARWFSANPGLFLNCQGLWIGIKGHKIEARGASLSEVHDQLTRMEILDALIVHVPSDLGHPRTLIA
jgi:hypothetical protein